MLLLSEGTPDNVNFMQDGLWPNNDSTVTDFMRQPMLTSTLRSPFSFRTCRRLGLDDKFHRRGLAEEGSTAGGSSIQSIDVTEDSSMVTVSTGEREERRQRVSRSIQVCRPLSYVQHGQSVHEKRYFQSKRRSLL